MLSGVRDRVGAVEAGPAEGTVTPASLGAGSAARGELACVLVSGFPTSGGRAGAVVARLGLAGALRARSGSGSGGGGFRRRHRLPGLGAGTGNPGAASAPLSQASPPSVEAAPILGGNPDKGGAPLADPGAPAWCREALSATQAIGQLGVYRVEVPRLPLPASARKEPLRLS